ncbi:carboxymuconolactone decarboxylase family protein [Cupriavidus sp. CuC1]|uniref:carboxymuconolactone decarboxylase family protein n=1 Tax=Cupriavidus sp. CuC1 TaxID=3373131 RepID=UPI0037D791CF
MSQNTSSNAAREIVGKIAPKLAQLNDEVLFADVWERPQLSKRDRSLITCTALVAMGKTDQMKSHFPRAIANGVTKDELVEMFTHMAFYAGWPSAVTAVMRFDEIFGDTLAEAPSNK